MENNDQILRFFGRGSAFSDEHNSSLFCSGSDLVLLDHSITAFNKLRKLGPDHFGGGEKISHIYVIVTHTHSDHISGIPLLIHYSYYVWHLPVTVAVGSEEVGENMLYYLDKLEGCDKDSYNIIPADDLGFVTEIIPTEHTPNLDGKCFGYQLDVNGKKVIYTGDTRTLLTFLAYIDSETALYTEVSAVDSGVHLFIGDYIDVLKAIASKGTEVYLMHLDDEKFVEDVINGTSLKLAPLI